MGKLLSGRYGQDPDAESGSLSLQDCSLKLGLKPSDFVSGEAPEFFKKAHGARGNYLVFQVTAEETGSSPVWRPGYYLLPLDAQDVLKAFERNKAGGPAGPRDELPVRVTSKVEPPPPVVENARRWASSRQPLFFKCGCDHLELRLDPPWALRKRWRARLRCPRKCQPAAKTEL